MTGTWADSDDALEHAREILAELYPGERVEIVETVDIAWVGRECDFQGALITHDGVPELVIVDATGVNSGRPVAVTLRERLVEYGRLVVETGAVLRRHKAMLLEHVRIAIDERGPEDLDDVKRRFDAAMAEMAEMVSYFAVPDDGMPPEVADAVEQRVQQLADAGGRIALDVSDLTEEELELIADSEVAYVPLFDAALDSEEAIEAEAVAVQRYERVVELSKRLVGMPTDADDIVALEAVLALARDYARRSGDLREQYWLAEQIDLNDWRPPVALRGLGDLEYLPRPRPDEPPAVYARRYWRFFWLRERGQLVYEPDTWASR